MNNENQAVIKEIVEELLQKMGFPASVAIGEEVGVAQTTYICSVRVSQGQNFLIGQYGMNLAALQHLVRIIMRKKLGEKLDIVVDVNDYFSGKKQLLEREAAQALKEALQNNVSVALRPMLSYERKVVHAFLSTNNSVVTESVGQGDERKVMVRPRPMENE